MDPGGLVPDCSWEIRQNASKIAYQREDAIYRRAAERNSSKVQIQRGSTMLPPAFYNPLPSSIPSSPIVIAENVKMAGWLYCVWMVMAVRKLPSNLCSLSALFGHIIVTISWNSPSESEVPF